MARRVSPFDYWINAMQISMVMAEAQSVVAMRVLGSFGLWSVPGSETERMVNEKIYALSRSWADASFAALSGAPPVQITAAAIKPIRQKTRANSRRLAKRGPKRV